MKKARAPRQPKICYHKPTGQAYVRLEGEIRYLGRYDDPASHEKGLRLIAEWLHGGRRLPVAPDEITIAELGIRYLEYAESIYVRPDGRPSGETSRVRRGILTITTLYGCTPAAEFGPKALRLVREQWIADKLARTQINALTGMIRRMFRWAASHELIPVHVHAALTTVEGLRKGRTTAKESNPVRPVPMEAVEKVKQILPRQIAAMIDLQILTGARGGEICVLRPCDIDMSGEIWIASPPQHKNAWRGEKRTIPLGPRAQEILKPFLLRPATAYLFDPREVRRESHANATTPRRDNQPRTPRKTDRVVGECYDTISYAQVIARACEKAGIERWSPHRLRHHKGTEIRKQFGLEAAQSVLGHKHARVTEIYAERNLAKAVEIAALVG